MGKAWVVLTVVLTAGTALAQQLPRPLPENDTQAHAWAVADKQYPSAKVCAQCHPYQYQQWSLSSHAYANLSPMFNKFEQTINDLSSGTVNYFCVRCHASVGTSLAERRDIPWWDRAPAAREGITCVTCHRVGEAYGKANGARRITPGDISEPVFGPFDTTGVLNAISNARRYGILVSSDEPDKPGFLRIHQQAIQSDLLVKSEFCVTCHQVQVHPGIKLETVWEEYRASPAAKEGITCQDCHMSTTPGQPTGFARGAAAYVNGFTVNNDRPLSDHTFVGPGYPISHPGLFPLDENEFDPKTWLKFDWRAGWGSEPFESKVAASPGAFTFPAEWQSADDRRRAWKIVQRNLDRWNDRKKMRIELLERGSRLDGPFFKSPPAQGKALSFDYKLTNLNKGHNLPSGSLGAQPELWIDVALIGPDGGPPIWESGYVDSEGDMADFQSKGVQEGTVPFDHQLVNMQAKFITTNVKGTDREMFLPINLDVDQLPFIRPGGAPTSVLNHPPGARMEKRSIPPLGTRVASYTVPAEVMNKPGTYKLAIRLRGRTEPMYFMNFVESTVDMKHTENDWVTDTHKYAVAFDVH
jgi:Cytochrome c554 and c-prime